MPAPLPTVRFAPSPTGRLHVGNIRTAVLNWLFVRKAGGRFMLRLDDTDRERSTEAFAAGIAEDLAWLGLAHDLFARQSDRMDRYDEAIARLKAAGRLYPCYETPPELERRRARQRQAGRPPVYDRAALRLDEGARARFEAEGRRPHWRFLLPNFDADPLRPGHRETVFEDLIRGRQAIDLGSMSDPVLVREDGTVLYTLSSVVDDIDFAVTHVIRGEDHVTNTGVQIALFEALGAAGPRFGHHSLLTGADGRGLSKRDGSLSIEAMRAEGLEPLAIVSHAATIGTSGPVRIFASLEAAVADFDLGALSRAPARFEMAELEALNARLLHERPFDLVAERLAAIGIGGDAPFWDAVRGNLRRLDEARAWWQVVEGPVQPVIEDAELLEKAVRLFPQGPVDEATWGAWTKAIGAVSGRKGRALYHPLRLALTGREAGPELRLLLPLIGRERALKRLSGETA